MFVNIKENIGTFQCVWCARFNAVPAQPRVKFRDLIKAIILGTVQFPYNLLYMVSALYATWDIPDSIVTGRVSHLARCVVHLPCNSEIMSLNLTQGQICGFDQSNSFKQYLLIDQSSLHIHVKTMQRSLTSSMHGCGVVMLVTKGAHKRAEMISQINLFESVIWEWTAECNECILQYNQ